ncbi:uncharacterized protein EAF02_002757 [Botrytis sinoallii]|uniref:uncharacterized protein n=1 Tax=Botrytis sinoallii TaxID=1463999 RepID=UPI001901590C|nr:uncharacterized protein EAF02_002757 [Botrytis sinoallii]KAF7888216.1 hypothetical protein EAF02_002757 [Botrytis sinoallii]
MSSPNLGPLAMSQTKDDLVKHLNISAETYTLMAKETDVVYRWLISEKCHLKGNCKGKPPYDWSDIVERSKDEAMKLIVQNGTDQTAYYWNLAKPTPDCPNWIARWFLYHKFRYRDGRNRNIRADSRDTAPYNPKPPSHHHHNNYRHSHHSYPSHHRNVQVDEQYSHSSYYSSASMNTGMCNGFYPPKLSTKAGSKEMMSVWNVCAPYISHKRPFVQQFATRDSQGYNYSSTEPSSSTSRYATYSSSQAYAPSSTYVSYASSPITRESGQTKPYDPVRDL